MSLYSQWQKKLEGPDGDSDNKKFFNNYISEEKEAYRTILGSKTTTIKVLDKLYYNMLNAKAKWLYGLEEWDDLLPEEQRLEIKKQFNEDHRAVSHKVGRNDPCPCGSGKKYKKCCGANK